MTHAPLDLGDQRLFLGVSSLRVEVFRRPQFPQRAPSQPLWDSHLVPEQAATYDRGRPSSKDSERGRRIIPLEMSVKDETGEKIFLNKGGLLVTNARFVARGEIYPVSNIKAATFGGTRSKFGLRAATTTARASQSAAFERLATDGRPDPVQVPCIFPADQGIPPRRRVRDGLPPPPTSLRLPRIGSLSLEAAASSPDCARF